MKKIIHCACASCAVIMLAVSCSGKAGENDVALYANAHEMYSRGKFPETAALLNSVRKFPPALTLRAKAEYFSGDLESAEKSCMRAIRFRPGAFEAKFCLARVLWEKGEGEKAGRMLANLLADNPNDVRLLRFAAAAALERGDAAASAVYLDQAAQLAAEGAMVLLDRARLRWVSGRGDDALDDLARAKAMLPWDTPAARSINNLENRITEAMQ